MARWENRKRGPNPPVTFRASHLITSQVATRVPSTSQAGRDVHHGASVMLRALAETTRTGQTVSRFVLFQHEIIVHAAVHHRFDDAEAVSDKCFFERCAEADRAPRRLNGNTKGRIATDRPVLPNRGTVNGVAFPLLFNAYEREIVVG